MRPDAPGRPERAASSRRAEGPALLLLLACGCASSSSPPAPGTAVASAPADPAPRPADPAPPADPPPIDPGPAAGKGRIEGPGFSVELPDGTVKADNRDNYDDGEYVVGADGFVVMAIWHAGGIVGNPSAEQAMVQATARSAGLPLTLQRTTDPVVHGKLTARTYDLSLEGSLTVLITVIECGRRAVSVAVAGPDPAIASAHAAAVTSFRCTPDPARETRPGAPPVEVAVPRDFQRLPMPDDELRIFRATDGLSFNWAPAAEDAAYQAMFEAALLHIGFETHATPTDPINGRAAWRSRGPGGQVALATVFPCGARQVIGIYAGRSERDGRKWLTSARCPG